MRGLIVLLCAAFVFAATGCSEHMPPFYGYASLSSADRYDNNLNKPLISAAKPMSASEAGQFQEQMDELADHVNGKTERGAYYKKQRAEMEMLAKQHTAQMEKKIMRQSGALDKQ